MLLCLLAMLLVLKAAVPMFAAGAAQMRGAPVAEVCTVYGVTLPGPSNNGRDERAGHAHHHTEHSGHEDHSEYSAGAHPGDHCALTALATLAVPDMAMPAVTPAHAVAFQLPSPTCAGFRDASAAWFARLKHGPPSLG